MKVGFTGTQQGITDQQKDSLREYLSREVVDEFHHGDCIGADYQALGVVKSLSRYEEIRYGGQCSLRIVWIKTISHPPDIDGKRAFTTNDETREPKPYLDRNQDIVDESDLLIACPKEQIGEELRSGTWATVRRARKRGIQVVIIRPNGLIVVE